MRSRNCRNLLVVFFLLSSSPGGAQVFRDVPDGHWASREAQELRDRGILRGWGDALHGERSFTRYEMVHLVHRLVAAHDRERDAILRRLEALEDRESALEARVDELFRSPAAGPGEEARPATEKGSPVARALTERLSRMHEKIREHRSRGYTSPLLVVPPGSRVRVSLPDLLLDEEGADFREGVHLLHWGAHVQVPESGAASVLYPGEQGGYVLLAGSLSILRPGALDRRAGNVQAVSVTKDRDPPPIR